MDSIFGNDSVLLKKKKTCKHSLSQYRFSTDEAIKNFSIDF